jgi:hypothetical protein
VVAGSDAGARRAGRGALDGKIVGQAPDVRDQDAGVFADAGMNRWFVEGKPVAEGRGTSDGNVGVEIMDEVVSAVGGKHPFLLAVERFDAEDRASTKI